MNSYEIGRAFEKEAYKFLKGKFDKVIWVSKKCWTSPFDFECYKDGKRFLIDVKASRCICIQRKKEVNIFITKIHNEIKIIPPIKVDLKDINSKTIMIDIPPDLNMKLKIYKIENNLKNLQEAIIQILNKAVRKLR